MSDIMDKLTAYQLDPENEAVQAYFEKDNIWTILDVQRYEPSHSAFLVWFFSQKFKQYVQIRNLLLLLIKKAEPKILEKGWNNTSDMELFASAIITGSFTINSVSIMPEYVVKKLSKIKSVDRIDIFIRCSLTLYDKKGKEEEKSLEIFIENKVDSAEGDEKVDNNKQLQEEYRNKKQTERYFYACSKVDEQRELQNPNYQLFVFLTPDRKQCKSTEYVLITYQDLVDYVFENILKRTDIQQDVIDLIDSYLRNLGNPYNKNNKDIIAMAIKEQNLLVSFYERNKELFAATIEAMIMEAENKNDPEVAQYFQNIKDSLSKSRYKYYSIEIKGKSRDGRYRMYQIIEEYIKYKLKQNVPIEEVLRNIQDGISKRAKPNNLFVSMNADKVKKGSSKTAKPHKGEFGDKTFYITKELSDTDEKSNFDKFRKFVDKYDSDFKFVLIQEK